MTAKFDAILIVSFGGPEGPEDVMPFLRNVVRGKNVPEERLRSVARHYELFDGISPINQQNRQLIALLKVHLAKRGLDLPVFWGNRNWHPMLEDTVAAMAESGVKRALAFTTSAYSSYSGCRQYLEDIERARAAVGGRAPEIEKIKPFYNREGFLKANEERLKDAIAQLGETSNDIHVAFSAHSIPLSMSRGCQYESQLLEVSRTLAARVGVQDWKLVFQSRSGPPSVPWLEPDISDHLKALSESDRKSIVVAPIGFVSDHMEVMYDLDTEVMELAQELGIKMVRAQTAGTHPAYIGMIVELLEEHIARNFSIISPCSSAFEGMHQENHDSEMCNTGCCLYTC
jgi:ferrochelatase